MAAALIGSLVVTAPAAASDETPVEVLSEGLEEPLLDDASTDSGGALSDDGDDSTPDDSHPGDLVEESPEGEEPSPLDVEDPAALGADESGGSYGPVDETTFAAMWEPGSVVPSRVSVVLGDGNVKLLTLAPEDKSSLLALLVIDSAEAATEYRFRQAVPPGHSAGLRPDGSVRFLDSDGKEVGGIAAPWAYGADGKSVATEYRLEGDTLIQTIRHQDAVHPVLADPWWIPVVVIAVKVVIAAQRASTATRVAVGTCAASRRCSTIAKAVVDHGVRAGSKAYRVVRKLSTGGSSGDNDRSCKYNARGRRTC